MAHSPAQAQDGTGFKQDLRDLGQGVGTIRDDVKNLAQTAASAAKSGATELREGAKHMGEVAKDKIESAKQAAADATDTVKDTISRNPLAAIGIAAGVGILLGVMISRMRR